MTGISAELVVVEAAKENVVTVGTYDVVVSSTSIGRVIGILAE